MTAMPEQNLISIRKEVSVAFAPDTFYINLTLRSGHETYEEVYEQARSNNSKVAKVVKDAGGKSIKTEATDFEVATKTVPEHDEQGRETGTKIVEPVLTQRVKIEFKLNAALLVKVVNLIGEHIKNAEMEIFVKASDSHQYHLKAMEKAVRESKELAETMAKAGGAVLGAMKYIHCNSEECNIDKLIRRVSCAEEALELTEDTLNADDFRLNETVVVSSEWYLQ